MSALILWVAGLLFGVYFVYPKFFNKADFSAATPLLSRDMRLLDGDLKEKLTFFMAKKLALYKGKFEIVDMIKLDTYEAIGLDYILIIMKAPNGKLCQVTISRSRLPWVKWQIDPENFSEVDIPLAESVFELEKLSWLDELGVSPDQARRYYQAHPEIEPWSEAPFVDKTTGLYKLPSDWKEVASAETTYKLDISKDEKLGYTTSLKIGKTNPVSTYWKVDYPTDYLGPGYRAYLYEKVKQE